MRFASAIREGLPLVGDTQEPLQLLREVLGLAPVFVVDNVADFVARTMAPSSDGKIRIEKDRFPNIAPPFDMFWVEYRDGSGVLNGAMFTAELFAQSEKYDDATRADWLKDFPGAYWAVYARQFMSYGPGEPGVFCGDWRFLVDRNGAELYSETEASAFLREMSAQSGEAAAETPMTWTMYPILVAISFLHCRNVTFIETPPSRAERRRAERSGKEPPVSYKTLVIEPMRKVLETEGSASTNGLAKALHICRGHFRTYEEQPLFGRYRGTFFVPAHVRGKDTLRRVEKTYEVRSESRAAESDRLAGQ